MREKSSSLKGKVFCLIDTDPKRHKEYINEGLNNLRIRRLSNENSNDKISLLTLKHSDTSVTDIEQSFKSVIFQKVCLSLSLKEEYKIMHINNSNGNSNFIKNFKNLDIEEYFQENNGNNKIIFANKYVELMFEEENSEDYIPSC